MFYNDSRRDLANIPTRRNILESLPVCFNIANVCLDTCLASFLDLHEGGPVPADGEQAGPRDARRGSHAAAPLPGVSPPQAVHVSAHHGRQTAGPLPWLSRPVGARRRRPQGPPLPSPHSPTGFLFCLLGQDAHREDETKPDQIPSFGQRLREPKEKH